MKNSILMLATWLFAIASLPAQKFKWGDIPEEDLKMKVYPLDSQAAAVVLAERGELDFVPKDDQMFYSLETHVRIKILTKAGLDRGDVKMTYYSKNNAEKISGVDVQVFSPDGKKTKVPDSQVFFEKVDDEFSSVRFAVPGLKEGSVFEYRYRMVSERFWSPDTWYFQQSIPVRRSELILNIPNIYQYGFLTTGGSSIKKEDMGSSDRYLTANVMATINRTMFYAENVPAMQPEPYITTMQNHVAKMKLQLYKIVNTRQGDKSFLSSWPELAIELRKNDFFGRQYLSEKKFDDVWAFVAAKLDPKAEPIEKVKKIYEVLNTKMDWNEEFGVFADRNLDDVFASGKGSGAELNLMLVACLRKAGFEANPLIISTPSHGYFSKLYPLLSQFNHTMAHVLVDSVPIIMDLGNEYRPYNLIRSSAQSGEGFLVIEPEPQFIAFTPPTDVLSALITLKIAEDGTLTGSMDRTSAGYEALSVRADLNEDKTLKRFSEKLQKSHPEIVLDTVRVSPHASQPESMIEHFNFTLPAGAQVSGDMIYLTPPLLRLFDENPFKNPKRLFPVEFVNKRRINYTVNIEVPAGYAVAELPETVNMKLPEDGASFRMAVGQNDGKVQVSLRVNLNQLEFPVEQYEGLRKFYDLVLEKQSEQIVFKKI